MEEDVRSRDASDPIELSNYTPKFGLFAWLVCFILWHDFEVGVSRRRSSRFRGQLQSVDELSNGIRLLAME